MKTLGFRARLTLAVSLLIATVTGFFAFALPRQQGEAVEEGLQARAMSSARVLATLIAPDLERGDVAEVDEHLQLLQDGELLYAVVFDKSGKAVATVKAKDEILPLLEAPSVDDVATMRDGERLEARAPLRAADGSRLGSMTIVMSRAAVIEAQETSRRNALIASAIILILAVVVARLITRPLVGTAAQLATVSSDLIAAAHDQETSAAQEGAAVAETRQSMETLLRSAQEIAERSSEVLGNAERSMARNREIADKLGALSAMLASIMDIADKTDLLALNAALEGTRAGEAGKGFALVAAEMRRLAESVMKTASEIRELMEQMHHASESAMEASREGTVSSEKIALLTQQQRQATEAVILSMDEMANVLAQTLAGIQRSTQSANTLANLANVMTGMLGNEERMGSGNAHREDAPLMTA